MFHPLELQQQAAHRSEGLALSAHGMLSASPADDGAHTTSTAAGAMAPGAQVLGKSRCTATRRKLTDLERGPCMRRSMAADKEIIHEVLPERLLGQQIAATVRKIGWSYAFFWSFSTEQQPGVLAWSAGCYNGQIKTRKTKEPVELDAGQMRLHRSKQLRELYESLTSIHCERQTKRSFVSLSPEDLTDGEWYYLICMSFTFNLGRGLPGKAFAENQYIWLSNATIANPMVFPRSLLAKSASIQTIVCIPIMGGVLELGTTEPVTDDDALVMRITSFFAEQSIHSPMMVEYDEGGILCPSNDASNSTIIEEQNSIIDCQTLLESISPTNEYCFTQQPGDFLKINGLNNLSQTWNEQQLMDDDFSNILHGSFSTSEEDASTSLGNADRVRNMMMLDNLHGKSNSKLTSLDLDDGDSHYADVVTEILQNSGFKRQVLCALKVSQDSSFVGWIRSHSNTPKRFASAPQKMLKRILIKKHQEEKVSCPEGESGASHVLSERRRREKLNEKFLTLRSLIPSVNKIDKVSVLSDTIEYLKELQRRVQQLETGDCRTNHPDALEIASDCHCNREMMKSKRESLANKRKAWEIDAELHWALSRCGSIDINVTKAGREVLVEIQCPWRDCLLVQIVESINELQLDPLVVQSSTTDGILALTIESKIRSSPGVSPRMIKESLERVIGRCLQ